MEQEKYTIELLNKQDREAVALALYRAGYTVREVKVKEAGRTATKYLLEYWR